MTKSLIRKKFFWNNIQWVVIKQYDPLAQAYTCAEVDRPNRLRWFYTEEIEECLNKK